MRLTTPQKMPTYKVFTDSQAFSELAGVSGSTVYRYRPRRAELLSPPLEDDEFYFSTDPAGYVTDWRSTCRGRRT